VPSWITSEWGSAVVCMNLADVAIADSGDGHRDNLTRQLVRFLRDEFTLEFNPDKTRSSTSRLLTSAMIRYYLPRDRAGLVACRSRVSRSLRGSCRLTTVSRQRFPHLAGINSWRHRSGQVLVAVTPAGAAWSSGSPSRAERQLRHLGPVGGRQGHPVWWRWDWPLLHTGKQTCSMGRRSGAPNAARWSPRR
jgi:hypothetical protein